MMGYLRIFIYQNVSGGFLHLARYQRLRCLITTNQKLLGLIDNKKTRLI